VLPVSAAYTNPPPAPNPPLDLACSLNVIFVMDESGSIVGAGGVPGILTEVRDAANGFLNALADTGSEIAIIEFNTTARLALDFMPLTSASVTNVLTPYVNGTGPSHDKRYNPNEYDQNTTPSYYTNWEDALDEVAALNASQPISERADLVVFFTDGNPTAHNTFSGVSIDAGNVSAHVPYALSAANVVKGQGSHIFVVGVPNPTLTESNVQAISGVNKYPNVTTDFSIADYSISTSEALFASLRDIAFALCEGSVSVTKTIYDGQDYVPVPGWVFTGTVTVTSGGDPDDYNWLLPAPTGDAGVIGTTKAGVTDKDGNFTWQWKPFADYPTQIVLDENTEGVEFTAALCTRSAPGQDDEVLEPITSLPVTISMGLEDFVTCEFQNNVQADWGDAPDSYATLAATLGPRHVILPGASVLGSAIDAEPNGLPLDDADGDDLDGIDDEDGVVVPANAAWDDGQGEIDITVSGPGCLNAWIDFKQIEALGGLNIPDGAFIAEGEQVISNTVALAAGTETYTFPLPAGEIHDMPLKMRFRITPLVDGQCDDSLYLGIPYQGDLLYRGRPSPYGVALGGEIEDHVREFGPTAIALLDVSTESEVSRLPFLGFAVLLGVSMLALAHYRRRKTQ
ncbi:MAG: vWA domain-containing protein, partial [Candidatus Promineifilaceae bacterium]